MKVLENGKFSFLHKHYQVHEILGSHGTKSQYEKEND
jgi:hypothetical protein